MVGVAELPADLRTVARSLAGGSSTGPGQASLRRAVGTAYYALFHQLIADAAAAIVGEDPGVGRLRVLVGRTFVHGEMVKASKAFAEGRHGLPGAFRELGGASAIPDDLRLVAGAFLDLQQVWQRADYDTASALVQPKVLVLLDATGEAMEAWTRVREHPAARLYLISLLLWNRIPKE